MDLETPWERSVLQVWFEKKKKKSIEISVDHGRTFDNPPENNAKEKSARWLINWNFREALPVFVYCELWLFAYIYWDNIFNIHRLETCKWNCSTSHCNLNVTIYILHTFIGAEHIYGVCSFGSFTGGQVDELQYENITPYSFCNDISCTISYLCCNK